MFRSSIPSSKQHYCITHKMLFAIYITGLPFNVLERKLFCEGNVFCQVTILFETEITF